MSVGQRPWDALDVGKRISSGYAAGGAFASDRLGPCADVDAAGELSHASAAPAGIAPELWQRASWHARARLLARRAAAAPAAPPARAPACPRGHQREQPGECTTCRRDRERERARRRRATARTQTTTTTTDEKGTAA